MPAAELLTTGEVARRLGVKPATVYAYVSRGMLERHPDSTRRRSLFERAAVERLAARARHTDRSSALDVVVDTELTFLDPAGRLFYRGRDAVELARFRTFEQVAALLWDVAPPVTWELSTEEEGVVRGATGTLPERATGAERIAVGVAALAAAQTSVTGRSPDAIRQAAPGILAAALDALGDDAPASDRSAAARVWAASSVLPAPPRSPQRAAVDAALVLLADHELAAGTLAARIAASAWADPYRVVLCGLGALGGRLQAAQSVGVEALLGAIEDPGDAARVLDERLGSAGRPVSGFGHRVYRDRDPRADHLLERLPACADGRRAAETVEALLEAAAKRRLPPPNVDFALAGLAHVTGMRPGAGVTIFTLARIAGLLAHAIEEHPHRLRFRPRARYVGQSPG